MRTVARSVGRRQVELPCSDLTSPGSVAVDTAGNVYFTDYTGGQVLKLPAGSDTQVQLPFTGLTSPDSVAVDTAGNSFKTMRSVYMAPFGNRVLPDVYMIMASRSSVSPVYIGSGGKARPRSSNSSVSAERRQGRPAAHVGRP